MKKVVFLFVLTVFSFNVYANITTQLCDAYDRGDRQYKATIEYDSELNSYKISIRNKIYYFDEKDEDSSYYLDSYDGRLMDDRLKYKPVKPGDQLHYMTDPDYSFKNCINK